VAVLTTPQARGRLAVGDFDRDGRPDLAFAGYDNVMTGGSATPDGRIGLPGPEPMNFALNFLRNTGQGSFVKTVSHAIEGGVAGLVAGDFDGEPQRLANLRMGRAPCVAGGSVAREGHRSRRHLAEGAALNTRPSAPIRPEVHGTRAARRGRVEKQAARKRSFATAVLPGLDTQRPKF
jgi:hypothetical protein